MSYPEVLQSARALSRIDKLRLIQVLAEELAQAEDGSPSVADRPSPVAAAAVGARSRPAANT